MATLRPINTVPRFYAHAITIENEAAERYREFAEHMKDLSRDTAALFEQLARDGFDHARELLDRTRGVRLPQLRSGAHAWLDKGSPLAAAHEWVFRLLSPRDALKVAMHAEQRAKRFFAHVVQTTGDGGVKALAGVFLKEEGEHIARMKRALLNVPNPVINWEKIYDHGGPLKRPRPAKTGAAGKVRTSVKVKAKAKTKAKAKAKAGKPAVGTSQGKRRR
jgi:rubrerythrin